MTKKKEVKEFKGLQYKKLKISYKLLVTLFILISITVIIMFNLTFDEKGISLNPIKTEIKIDKEFK